MNEIKEILTTLELMAETENLIAEYIKPVEKHGKKMKNFGFLFQLDSKKSEEKILKEIMEDVNHK